MSLGGNLSLCNDHFVADRAVLAFGQTCFRAGRGFGCVDHFCVTGCGDLFHTGDRSAADRALRTRSTTDLGAGSGLLSNIDRGMAGCVNRFSLGFIANRADIGLDAGVLTGRSGHDLALIPAVALGRNHSLLFDSRSADLAASAVRQAALGAGRRLARNGLLGVSGRRNHFLCNDHFVADGAVLALGFTGCSASRLDSRANDFGMTLGGNLGLCNENLVADRAVLTLGLTGLGAGSLDCRVNDLGMSLGGNLSLCNDHFVADRAVLTLGLAGFGAGRLDFRVNDFGVTLGGNLSLCN